MGAVDFQRDGPPPGAGTAAPVCIDAVIPWLIAISLRLAAGIGHRCGSGCKPELAECPRRRGHLHFRSRRAALMIAGQRGRLAWVSELKNWRHSSPRRGGT